MNHRGRRHKGPRQTPDAPRPDLVFVENVAAALLVEALLEAVLRDDGADVDMLQPAAGGQLRAEAGLPCPPARPATR
jgi:hypothetical protein